MEWEAESGVYKTQWMCFWLPCLQGSVSKQHPEEPIHLGSPWTYEMQGFLPFPCPTFSSPSKQWDEGGMSKQLVKLFGATWEAAVWMGSVGTDESSVSQGFWSWASVGVPAWWFTYSGAFGWKGRHLMTLFPPPRGTEYLRKCSRLRNLGKGIRFEKSWKELPFQPVI